MNQSAQYKFDQVLIDEPGWYSGDFHAHTSTSPDGHHPPTVLAELARVEGLDFVSITDHNTIQGRKDLDPGLDFMVIPGMEVTLDHGHFNVFGIGGEHQWIEEIDESGSEVPLPANYPTVDHLLERTKQAGLLNSLNHPLLHPWAWRYQKTDPGKIHFLEIWNDLYWPGNTLVNPKAVEMWTHWLNRGYRVTAIGGSDFHLFPKPEQNIFGECLSQPTTLVYADNLSILAILEGLLQRRAYVTKGPRIEVHAAIGAAEFGIGDDLGDQSGKLDFTVSVEGGPEQVFLDLVRNGTTVKREQVSASRGEIELGVLVNPDSPDWYRLEVKDKNWELLTITNPVFLNYREQKSGGSPEINLWF